MLGSRSAVVVDLFAEDGENYPEYIGRFTLTNKEFHAETGAWPDEVCVSAYANGETYEIIRYI